jgi:hypothetical protein
MNKSSHDVKYRYSITTFHFNGGFTYSHLREHDLAAFLTKKLMNTANAWKDVVLQIDNELFIYNLFNKQKIKLDAIDDKISYVSGVWVLRGGNILVFRSRLQKLIEYDGETGKPIRTVPTPNDMDKDATGLQLSNGKVAIACCGSNIYLYCPANGDLSELGIYSRSRYATIVEISDSHVMICNGNMFKSSKYEVFHTFMTDLRCVAEVEPGIVLCHTQNIFYKIELRTQEIKWIHHFMGQKRHIVSVTSEIDAVLVLSKTRGFVYYGSNSRGGGLCICEDEKRHYIIYCNKGIKKCATLVELAPNLIAFGNGLDVKIIDLQRRKIIRTYKAPVGSNIIKVIPNV